MTELHNREESAKFHAAQEKKAAEEAAALMKDKVLKITARAGSAGRLFGSVTTKEVAEELAKQFGVRVDKRKISMTDIKSFGTYTAEVKLYTGVVAKLSVMVTE